MRKGEVLGFVTKKKKDITMGLVYDDRRVYQVEGGGNPPRWTISHPTETRRLGWEGERGVGTYAQILLRRTLAKKGKVLGCVGKLFL